MALEVCARISWVGACTLVVEGVFNHFIQCCHEIFFGDSIFLDGSLNAYPCLQISNGFNEVFKSLPWIPTKRAISQYLSLACGYGYWEKVPIFVGAGSAL